MKRTLVPRGIALNYAYLKTQLNETFPHIYEIVTPEMWVDNLVSIPNTIKDYPDNKFVAFFEATEQRVYLDVYETYRSWDLRVGAAPSQNIIFVGLPGDRVTEETHQVAPADFNSNNGKYESLISLTSTNSPYELTLTNNNGPVYFDTILQNENSGANPSILLISNEIPSFTTTLTAHILSES